MLKDAIVQNVKAERLKPFTPPPSGKPCDMHGKKCMTAEELDKKITDLEDKIRELATEKYIYDCQFADEVKKRRGCKQLFYHAIGLHRDDMRRLDRYERSYTQYYRKKALENLSPTQ